MDAGRRVGTVEAGWSVELIDSHRSLPLGLNPALRRGTSVLSRGDSLLAIDIEALLAFHHGHSHLATIVAVPAAPSFGRLDLVGREVVDFALTRPEDTGWLSAGLFVLEPEAFDCFNPEAAAWEQQLIEGLTHAGELMAYKHESFWQSLSTPQDGQLLEALWQSDSPPWKNWT